MSGPTAIADKTTAELVEIDAQLAYEIDAGEAPNDLTSMGRLLYFSTLAQLRDTNPQTTHETTGGHMSQDSPLSRHQKECPCR